MIRTPVKKRRSKPRRGRVIDKARLEWMSRQSCCVTGERPATVHHVRFCGSLKDDTRILPLVARLHMRTNERSGEPCIERGKAVFEDFWDVDIEELVTKYQEMYREQWF